GNVARRFSAHGFERQWKKMEFDFRAKKPTPISEVVFVFTNDRVGEAKKGVLQFRNVDLIPLKKPEAAVTKSEETVPAVAAVSAPAATVVPVSTVPVPGATFTSVPVTVTFEAQTPDIPQEIPLD
ncbi:MAG: hypothetical protein KTQ49_07875, partial [Candidatus Omnitrophica bacterium]|nr:hypothetical protein [Candidatus Omnitrophota bacterium]